MGDREFGTNREESTPTFGFDKALGLGAQRYNKLTENGSFMPQIPGGRPRLSHQKHFATTCLGGAAPT